MVVVVMVMVMVMVVICLAADADYYDSCCLMRDYDDYWLMHDYSTCYDVRALNRSWRDGISSLVLITRTAAHAELMLITSDNYRLNIGQVLPSRHRRLSTDYDTCCLLNDC